MSYVGNKPAQKTIPADDSVTTAMIKDDAVTADKIANAINTEISANTAKVTNATHTGDVTGATALTIAAGAVDVAMLSATGSASSSTVLYGDGTWKAEPTTDTSGLEDDIALIGFKVAANGSLAKYDLVDQTVDDFQDASGVDASASTNEVRDNGGKYYSGVDAVNYFGNSDLGTVTFGSSSVSQSGQTSTIDSVLSTGSASGGPGSSSYGGAVPNSSACYELTVPNEVSSYDGDMVCAQFANLTIDSGVTLTTKRACRGLFIYVAGDCTINGALSMSCRGGFSNPTISGGSDSSAVSATGIRLAMKTASGTSTLAAADFAGAGNGVKTAVANQGALSGNATIFVMSRNGGTRGAAGTTGGATISTGGGADGTKTGGAGSWNQPGKLGGCFQGGSGGGGAWGTTGSDTAVDYGGPGGNGAHPSNNDMAGGAGNPKGSSNSYAPYVPQDGVGGVIWLVVKGDLTIGSGATIEANGAKGGKYAGGSSGGGAIHALYAGTLSNSGSINANGGPADGSANILGGGAGGVNTAQVSGSAYNNMTLVSTATTAVDGAPTKGDLVITYTDGAGTATINTDIKAYISRDGSAYTSAVTLTSQGTSGGHKILTAHDVDLSGIASGTSMRWKIETLNQSISKATRIQAVSLGWS